MDSRASDPRGQSAGLAGPRPLPPPQARPEPGLDSRGFAGLMVWVLMKSTWHGLHLIIPLICALPCAGDTLAADDAAKAPAPRKLESNRDVRPILSENCFKCHGQDPAQRKSELRLDVREEALKPARSGKPAIVAKDPEASGLIERITPAPTRG